MKDVIKQKVILITGSTDGIGKQTALELAAMNYRVIVHGRSEAKAAVVAEEIRRSTGNDEVSGVWGDLASLQQVADLNGQVTEITDRLDVLINNAGIIAPVYQTSAEGYEMTFAVCHLAHFYLTYLLFPLVEEQGRIINVASQVHARTLNLHKLNDPKSFGSFAAYEDAKMCNVLFTYALDRRLNGDRHISVHCLHPGVVNTKMLRRNFGSMGIPVEKGAAMVLYAATSEAAGVVSGCYYKDMKEERSAAASYDTALQDELWEMSVEMVRKAGLAFDEKRYSG